MSWSFSDQPFCSTVMGMSFALAGYHRHTHCHPMFSKTGDPSVTYFFELSAFLANSTPISFKDDYSFDLENSSFGAIVVAACIMLHWGVLSSVVSAEFPDCTSP
uniref:AlNc14C5G702 protein n=1 Tax=Albugo laibachii Nc14 TaxID=890382 RepID=F0W0R7_9STRA|nr:AlNc14C5G702 [Albugo laibachii Nc14]|eukprot:CCA14641.1 AlNc14C5G702 [Albugo laibachii Nc14]